MLLFILILLIGIFIGSTATFGAAYYLELRMQAKEKKHSAKMLEELRAKRPTNSRDINRNRVGPNPF